MSIVKSCLIHTITIWAQNGFKDDGNPKFMAPKRIKGRWVESEQMFVDQTGKEVVSNTTVYADRDLTVGTWVYLGKHFGLSPPQKAREIKGSKSTPSLNGKTRVTRYFL